jgi:hypothetical protein
MLTQEASKCHDVGPVVLVSQDATQRRAESLDHSSAERQRPKFTGRAVEAQGNEMIDSR